MINSIIEGISASLNAEFGDDYTIYTENVEQGLKEPCFFISCIAIIHLYDLSSIYNIFHCMILYILITSINNLQVQLFLVSYFLSH